MCRTEIGTSNNSRLVANMLNKISIHAFAGLFRENFENNGPNWSKPGSFVDKYHILHVVDLIFGYNGEKAM